MNEGFNRTINLIGINNFNKLQNSKVIIFGLGGVGGYVVEALARSGVGNIDLVDNDKIDITNINRQLIATNKTVGRLKTDCFLERIKDINPNCNVIKYDMFFLPENSYLIDFSKYDYVIDCVDTVSAKLEIISKAKEVNTRIISSMGTANKIDPTKFEIKDINQTSICPLARVMRYELKKRSISDVKVLYSKEETVKKEEGVKASIAFVPSVAGLLIASYVIKDLIK